MTDPGTGTSDHLTPTVSDRGFTRLPGTAGVIGMNGEPGEVRVYESSAADHPRIWLRLTTDDRDTTSGVAHLTTEHAGQLADQIRWLIQHHYQKTETR